MSRTRAHGVICGSDHAVYFYINRTGDSTLENNREDSSYDTD